ncbi:hypothetical protein HPB48_005183 [Haemaphysalis longicornis]|uniref:Uncharacterized protein n=1 Tax=Haemaphysalis longicornis TaxID=44386 RepID=A0A9J6FGV5_HAELO|nr:hypothetical protein HPB48_005183 [Haemaphysalis longicornis]
MDEAGNKPPHYWTWQFNFKFDLTEDMYAARQLWHRIRDPQKTGHRPVRVCPAVGSVRCGPFARRKVDRLSRCLRRGLSAKAADERTAAARHVRVHRSDEALLPCGLRCQVPGADLHLAQGRPQKDG